METPSGNAFDEKELLQLLILKSINGFNIFYDRYAPILYGIIISKVPDPQLASLVMEHTVLEIWQTVHQFNPDKQCFFTWLFQKTQRMCALFSEDPE